MPYTASVHKVMIASPSDVATERQIIRDVIHEWNAVHSEDKQIVLMPVSWETHSSPNLGERAQDVINKHVLSGADLLVATFWTRIGSPTGNSPSGTVEEIEEHLAEGKPAMLYFSTEPVRLDSVDEEQYVALRNFKNECLERGLIVEYDSKANFKDSFARHLAQTVLRDFAPGDQEANPLASTLNATSVPTLSDASKTLLQEAAEAQDGRVLRVRTKDGLTVRTNEKNFVDQKDPRTEARWEAAVRQLTDLRFLQDVGHKGEVFAVTGDGYEMADHLRKQG